jgi:uncharacterized protein (DUF1697 family)
MLSRPLEPRENDGMRYVALLRGINVGANNPVSMAKLKACLETTGFEAVTTYIQSGNVIFTAASSPRDELTRRIEWPCPIDQSLTIRNWNTTTKLLQML